MAGQLHPSPYQVGKQLNIEKHTPPEAFGHEYENSQSIQKSFSGGPPTDHTKFVLSHPPVETEPISPKESHVLSIMEELSKRRCGKGGGARLVRC